MAFGTKTNERPGTRAQTRHARVSASKAREVLDLIRGEHVSTAAEILEFSQRDVARVVLKTLDSAVANAENNDSIPADELYVSACFADEGPTLKRWRPRARGRATRINKRTTHITVIVSRLSSGDLERRRASEELRGGRGGAAAAAEARRQRVEKSRQRKADRRAEEEADHDHDHDHDEDVPSEDVPNEDVPNEDVPNEDAVDATGAPNDQDAPADQGADDAPEVSTDDATDDTDDTDDTDEPEPDGAPDGKDD